MLGNGEFGDIIAAQLSGSSLHFGGVCCVLDGVQDGLPTLSMGDPFHQKRRSIILRLIQL